MVTAGRQPNTSGSQAMVNPSVLGITNVCRRADFAGAAATWPSAAGRGGAGPLLARHVCTDQADVAPQLENILGGG